jgi:two-component system, OmpR family, response regulator MprA
VVDVMMPNVDGLAVCRVLRAEGDRAPVLMLTARVETPDRVAGLDAGADDYLPKPFDLDELLARLRALLRRASYLPEDTSEGEAGSRLGVGALGVDPAARRVWWADAELTLSKTEFDLLELLVRNEGIVLDHSTIYARIWATTSAPTRRTPPSTSATRAASSPLAGPGAEAPARSARAKHPPKV